jgi:hypothetical protein
LPADAPRISFDFETVPKRTWETQEWLHWLRNQSQPLTAAHLREIDMQWDFTHSGNSEITAQWLEMAIQASYEPAYPRLEEFLIEVGRRKFVKPLFEVASQSAGRRGAREEHLCEGAFRISPDHAGHSRRDFEVKASHQTACPLDTTIP